MKYIINELVKRHIEKLNKDVVDVKLDGVNEKVTIWQDFPEFIALGVGSEVEGDIVTKVNGNFTNITLYPPKEQVKQEVKAIDPLTAIVNGLTRRIIVVEEYIENHKNGKIPSDFSAEKVDARVKELDPKKVAKVETIEYPTEEINPEDIPF
jgi:hypothetical protein